MPRRFQFSLKTLLVAMLVVGFLVAIAFVLAGMREAAIERANRHRPAAKSQAQ
jgi:hypothetical protein